MDLFKIGLIREGKVPPDRRVVLTPKQCIELKEKFSGNNIEIVIQPGKEARAYKDNEYTGFGLKVSEDLSDCDLLLGVKEVPVENLIPGKTYMFFSHTIKLQPYNKKLLQAILDKKIKLIDYETLTDRNEIRLIGFGWYAGIVGCYNGFRALGNKYGVFDLKPANQCYDSAELEKELKKVVLVPGFKIVLTGEGRVAGGAMKMLEGMKIKKVLPSDFLFRNFDEPVFTQLKSNDLYKRKVESPWDLMHFYNYPEEYESVFTPYTKVSDMYLACHFWNSKSEYILKKEALKADDFKIRLVADISCDIGGPVASTVRSSTIADPFYGFDRVNEKESDFYSPDSIGVMAVDNLPCELPRDASEGFGIELINKIFPLFFGKDDENVIERATITENGKLRPKYSYMSKLLE